MYLSEDKHESYWQQNSYNRMKDSIQVYRESLEGKSY